jgi:hypothetical protein
MEQIRATGDSPPLRAIILGCTHFPFYSDAFQREIHRLRNYQEDGRYVYRQFMADEIDLIDPAYFTAAELYRGLAADQRLRSITSPAGRARGEFYVTVPCREKAGLEFDELGWFTYDQKYGRSSGRIESDFRSVPLDGTNLDQNVFDRLQRRVPAVWKLMTEFRRQAGDSHR